MSALPADDALIQTLQAHTEAAAVEATAALREVGFPNRRTERWKYTPAAPYRDFAATALARGVDTAAPAAELDAAVTAWHAAAKPVNPLVFIDGLVSEAHSALPAGLQRTPAPAKAPASASTDDALLLLNNASAGTAMALTVPAGAEERLDILQLTRGSEALAQTRLQIVLEAGAKLQITETLNAHTAGMCNTVMTLRLADGAECRHARLQSTPASTLVATRIDADIAGDATLSTLALDTGGKLVRNDLNARLVAPGARVDMAGIYLTDGEQHVDNHTHVDHIARDTTSNEDYRGVLRDASRAVFNGKVYVHEGADGTDASQSNRNLLLSDAAEIDTKPELEIYADDVKCAHGATVGQLDEDALFYLLARGVPRATATQLLTFAFCREALAGLRDASVRTTTEAMIAGEIPNFTALEALS